MLSFVLSVIHYSLKSRSICKILKAVYVTNLWNKTVNQQFITI
jgi:hypothetical protein